MQITHSLVAVAVELMAAPNERHWGYELSRASKVRSGVMYPILGRLLERGWVEDGWENPDEIKTKRPPRRYYTITPAGLEELGALARRAEPEARPALRPRLGLAHG